MNKNNFDRQARDLIINDIKTNYFVEAGAGSGKTTCLVSRMVNMVLSGIEVDKICAITFTKAAANEFYERFLKKLIDLRDKSKNNKENDLLNNAIRNIDMCFLGTMDSFVNTIMHEYPIEAGIPTNSKVIQDTKSYKTLVNNQLTKLIDGCENNNANSHELELFEKYKYAAYYNSNFNKNVVDVCSETLTNLRDYNIKYTPQNIDSKSKLDSFEKNFKYDKQILTTLCNVAHKYVILDKPDSKQYLYLDNLTKVSSILKMN
jgi:ATP-dependent exoDNAse (exonuclease V) beta subunit